MTTALRAELRKLRFSRSLWLVPAAGALLSVVTSGLVVAFFEEAELAARLSEHGPLRFGPTNVGLILVVFGIRVFADETHHHTLASTYVATPDRGTVLLAKAAVSAGVALAFCVLVFLLVVPITLVGVAARDVPMTIDVAATAGLLGRTSIAMPLLALLGLSLAAIVRNRAAALVACLVWLALLEDLVGSLFKIPALVPGTVVRALVSGSGGSDVLGPVAGALVLLTYALAGGGLAVARLRHDVS